MNLKIKIITPLLVCTALGANAAGSTVFYTQDFELGVGNGYTTTSQGTFGSPPSAHFIQTTNGSAFSSTYSNTSGSFLSGSNVDSFSGLASFGTPIMTTDTFSIIGETRLQFAIDIATNTTTPQWQSTSVVNFQYRVDSTSDADWVDIFAATDPDGHSQSAPPSINGVAITNNFSTFTANITNLSGSSMDIRVVWTDLSTLESLAIDNINVSSAPLPSAALAGLGLLAGLGAYRRIRR